MFEFDDEIKVNLVLEEFYEAIATNEEYEDYFGLKVGDKPPFIFNAKAYLKKISERITYKEFKKQFEIYLLNYIKEYYAIEQLYKECCFYLNYQSKTPLDFEEYCDYKLGEYEKYCENYVKEIMNGKE